jgi:hypothetical protein
MLVLGNAGGRRRAASKVASSTVVDGVEEGE